MFSKFLDFLFIAQSFYELFQIFIYFSMVERKECENISDIRKVRDKAIKDLSNLAKESADTSREIYVDLPTLKQDIYFAKKVKKPRKKAR